MKKVLIGILILIPIIIMVVVALVTNMLQLQAWVAVESLTVTDRLSGKDAQFLQPAIDVDENTIYDFNDFVQVLVYPDKANQTVDWALSEVECSDEEYKQKYEQYIQDPVGTPVYPAAVLIDSSGFGHEGTTNTSGKFRLYAYCSFEVTVSAETFSKTFTVNIIGSTVARVTLTDTKGDTQANLTVGESMRLSAAFVPLDSKVEELKFENSAPNVVSVDENGVITALGTGSAKIRALASKYDADGEGKEKEFVASNEFTVNVGAGAGRYGNKVTLERTQDGKYAIEKLGVAFGDINTAQCKDCTIADDGIVITGDSASVALKNGKTLAVEICEQGAIAIDHADIFEAKDGGYVLGTDERGLKLSASFAATAAEGKPSVGWSSDNTQVATVDADGVVKGISNGVATITATVNARAGAIVASVRLNVHEKISLLRLKTSEASLRMGLARETVFASYKYKGGTDAETQYDLMPNTVAIHLQGEPDDASAQKEYYQDFNFQIAEGGEYAHFDAEDPNMLVIDAAALEGNGVKTVKVMASAKYPLFEANSAHTTAYVTLNVVYGVDVTTFEQAIHAGQDQREYAYNGKEVLDSIVKDTMEVPGVSKLRVIEMEHPTGNFAITLANDIKAPDDIIFNYHDKDRCIILYGDFYGNGHIIASMPENLVDGASYTMCIACSDVSLSNVTIRHEDVQPEKLDSHTFVNSYCMLTYSENLDEERLTNVNVSYCIFENSHCGIEFDNTDGVVDGCLFRNISSVGFYHYERVYHPSDAADDEFNLCFSRPTFNNCVFSTIIAVSISTYTAEFALDSKGWGRFSAIKDDQNASIEDSYKWTENNLVSKGYISHVTQTGFLDIYNWQNATDANLIDTGVDMYNDLIRVGAQALFKHPDFVPGVYNVEKGDLTTSYFHIGMLLSAISTQALFRLERPFANITFEDDRFFSIYFPDVEIDYPGKKDPTINSTLELLHKLGATLYCYKKEASITPMSTYTVNSQFIDHLHEGK